MRILVIKQTSLGDVLHSTGHVRAIKKTWPDSELVLLTAVSSADIYRHNPWVDRMILVDRYRVKHNWYKEPLWCYRHMRDVLGQVRAEPFDIAFDLQGLAKSVIFLYGAKARKKFVKGRWPGLRGFRRPRIHAIKEMDGVLELAGIKDLDTSMEFATSQQEQEAITELLQKFSPAEKKMIIFSPFSRWASKDWPLDNYVKAARSLADRYLVFFTGTPDRATQVESALSDVSNPNIINLCGKLSLLQFAEITRRVALVLTGDSFPMHVAAACETRIVALFGPTDEIRVGPPAQLSQLLRAPDCRKCDRADCKRNCLARITVDRVVSVVEEAIERVEQGSRE